MPKLLVMGVGNVLLMDDGVGVWAVKELEQETWPDNVEFIDMGTATQDMFHLFQQYDELLVLDVVHAGHPPGTIYKLDEKALVQDETQRLSLHDVDLLDSLKMADMLGKRPGLRVLGLEPECYTDWKMELTEVVQAAFPKFLEAARREIRSVLESWGK